MVTRQVVVIFGPPGAGKTTHASTLGLPLYDQDDPHWTSPRHFTAALDALGADPHAQAVVIRSGATPTSRTKTLTRCRATEHLILTTDLATCTHRIRTRGNPHPYREIAAARDWWERYEPDPAPDLGTTSRPW